MSEEEKKSPSKVTITTMEAKNKTSSPMKAQQFKSALKKKTQSTHTVLSVENVDE